MLAKLLKYDFASLSRILLPVHAAAVVVGVVAAACFFFTGTVEGFYTPQSSPNPFAYILMPLGGMCLFALGAAPVATFVVIVRRWYANLFTDEGYLTLTLPVSANEHVASKTIAGFTWMMVDLVVVLALLIVSASVMSNGPINLFGNSSSAYDAMMSAWTSVLSMAGVTAQVLTIILLAYAAFALGAIMAARHRVAAGVGLFVGLSWLLGLVSAFASTAFAFAGYRSYASDMLSIVSSTTTIVLSLVVGAALYALCVYLLKNRVDLP